MIKFLIIFLQIVSGIGVLYFSIMFFTLKPVNVIGYIFSSALFIGLQFVPKKLKAKPIAGDANLQENLITKSKKNETQQNRKMLLFGFGSFGLPLALCLDLNNLALISALSLLIWYIWEEFLE